MSFGGSIYGIRGPMTVEDVETFGKSNFTKFINDKIQLVSEKNSQLNLNSFKKIIIDAYINKVKRTKKDYRFYLEQYTLVKF